MKRILISGNCGFIGSHLQTYLEKKGHEVIGLDNQRWMTRKMDNTVIGDVRDKKLIQHLVASCDEVYHLAAQINVDYGNEHPQDTLDINIGGTLNILEACKDFRKKLIFASTSEVYGTAQKEKISETHPLDCQGIYAASKVGADRLCKAYSDTYGVDARILRNFNTFGPYQRADSYGGVIAIFVDRALHNRPPVINGDGKQRRDYIWITDAIKGYELISERGERGRPINIGSGTTVTVNDIADIIRRETNCPKPIYTKSRPGEVMRLCADTHRSEELGFKPDTDFEKHLIKYINWRKNEYK